jgi:hypothetical protein
MTLPRIHVVRSMTLYLFKIYTICKQGIAQQQRLFAVPITASILTKHRKFSAAFSFSIQMPATVRWQ